jgi:hypothetical protein
VKILETADVRGIDPRLFVWLLVVDAVHRQAAGAELIVTSVRRPHGKRPSKHSPPPDELVTAADVRRWDLDKRGIAEVFARNLQSQYGPWLGVVLEPEWLKPKEVEERGGLAAIAPHLHVQLKGVGWPS